MTRREFVLSAAAAPLLAEPAPYGTPYGAVPSPRQLRWHEMETYAFLHFTVNTFTNKEWGYGDEDPSIFNPTAFDPDAIIAALVEGGMTGVIVTAKHHDGFCLWPTKTTDHHIVKGDIVRDISAAARRAGLRFGVYLSPWDRNNAQYGQPAYIDIYRGQLRELLTNYGPIFEVWHDGANGGDGYYGGAREKRTIDKRTYYRWPETWELVRKLQPDAVIFSDVGPDIRWVGNENGYAGETCWETFTPIGEDGGPASPGDVRTSESNSGTRHGKLWMPPECDVSIRPGWFWHEAENGKVKTPDQLMDLYFKSVGRGGSMLLNIPPDRRGLLHENDVASLKAFGQMKRAMFRTNLGPNVPVTTPSTTFELPARTTFSVIRLREDIRLGQRVEAFAVDAWEGTDWRTIAQATSIGNCRLLRLDAPVSTSRVRLRITQSPVAPALSDFSLFA
ncbi:MAG: alpha-L-fucosidase [Bryobacteraceae bacterium]